MVSALVVVEYRIRVSHIGYIAAYHAYHCLTGYQGMVRIGIAPNLPQTLRISFPGTCPKGGDVRMTAPDDDHLQ